jgi:Xaa-Pro aminopeptidase
VSESRRVDSLSPVLLKKSVKNPIEIEGMKRSHVSLQLLYSIRIDYHFNNVFNNAFNNVLNNKIKDAVALCEFFAWLEDEIPKGDVDELSAASKLEEFRRFHRFN